MGGEEAPGERGQMCRLRQTEAASLSKGTAGRREHGPRRALRKGTKAGVAAKGPRQGRLPWVSSLQTSKSRVRKRYVHFIF